MSILTGYYEFQLLPTKKHEQFVVNKIFKCGNNALFNDLFTQDLAVKFKKLNPEGLFPETLFYVVQFGRVVSKRSILFETSLLHFPKGIFWFPGTNDFGLFEYQDQNLFKIFVAEGRRNEAAEVFQLYLDGSLNEDIASLTSVFEKGGGACL